jgi:hypothetical protein
MDSIVESLPYYLDNVQVFFGNSQTIFWISFVLGCVWFYKGEGTVGAHVDKLQYSLFMGYKGLVVTQIVPFILTLFPPEAKPIASIVMLFFIFKHLDFI